MNETDHGFDGNTVRSVPCSECPWRRKAVPGWLGPHPAEDWVGMAHGETPIACHTTIEIDSEWTPNTMQCAGAAIYRSNVCKSPRDPAVAKLPADRDLVFGRRTEFMEHHDR